MTGTEVYEQLADALGRLPNGFPRTPSNAEIPLLQKIFSPERASLAALLSDELEFPSEVAEQAGVPAEAAETILAEMAEQGLAWIGVRDRRRVYRLAPFIVGIYEALLARMDPELARLIDDYMDDGGAVGIMGAEPAVHRVLPAQAAVKPEWVLPYDDVRNILDSAKSFRVRDCVCRLQMARLNQECEFPLNTCLIYYTAPRPSSPDDITREEALDVLDYAEEIGLVHTVSNVRTGSLLPYRTGYVCNCCGCCCMVLRGITKWGIENSVAHAGYYAEIDPDLCTECGDCLKRCQVKAISDGDEPPTVVRERCIGCGLCVTGCSAGAAELKRKPDEEIVVPPLNFPAWEEARRQSRVSTD